MMRKRLEYSPLVGHFHTEIGPLNRVLHIWEYEDLNTRSDVRSKVIADGIWPPPNASIVENQQVDIFLPAPFMPTFDRNRKIDFFVSLFSETNHSLNIIFWYHTTTGIKNGPLKSWVIVRCKPAITSNGVASSHYGI